MLTAPFLSAFGFQAADTQTLALTQGVKRQAYMLANGLALGVLDGARLFGDVAVQKLPEGPLANEANAGRVFLFGIRELHVLGNAAHLGLVQLADGEQCFG